MHRFRIARALMYGSPHKKIANSQRHDKSRHAVQEFRAHIFIIQDDDLSGYCNKCHQKDYFGMDSIFMEIGCYGLEEFQSD